MERLNSPDLVNSSQQAGNTVAAANAELAMTAPGSHSVLPVPDLVDVLPQPHLGPRTDYMSGWLDHRPTDRPAQSDATDVNHLPDRHPSWTET